MRAWFKRFFIPHEGNNFRPDFLERLSVGIMLVLILLSFAMANVQSLLWISSDWLVSTILPSVIVELTNEERDDANLGDLRRSSILDAAAQLKANDMAKHSYFSHYSPSGVSPWYWFDQAGYNYLHAGENLAVHFTNSDEVVEAWMDSPSHRANIVNDKYGEIGVGSARGEFDGYPTIFVVQLFGTPRANKSVAGVEAELSQNITVEKVVLAQAESDVAPATVKTETVTTTSEDTPVPPPVDEPVVDEVVTESVTTTKEKDSVVLTTNLATTSREGVPAVMDPTDDSNTKLPSPLHSAIASSLWLSAVYAVLAFVVVVSLSVSMVLEWRRHHPIQIAYAGGLITVMALLLYIHISLTGTVLIV